MQWIHICKADEKSAREKVNEYVSADTLHTIDTDCIIRLRFQTSLVWYYTVQYCTLLYCTILYCTVLYCMWGIHSSNINLSFGDEWTLLQLHLVILPIRTCSFACQLIHILILLFIFFFFLLIFECQLILDTPNDNILNILHVLRV